MELSNELINKIKKEYQEWQDDCEQQGLPVGINDKDVFNFLQRYCKPDEDIDKLINTIDKNDAKPLLNLYNTLVEYMNFLIRQGYDETFKELCNSLTDSLINIMEVY